MVRSFSFRVGPCRPRRFYGDSATVVPWEPIRGGLRKEVVGL